LINNINISNIEYLFTSSTMTLISLTNIALAW